MRGALVRLPLSSRPWRAVVYVIARLPLAALGAAIALLPLNRGWTGAAIAVPLLLAYAVAGIAFAPAERRLVTVLGRSAVADPHAEATLPQRLRDAATAREAGHALLAVVIAPLDAFMLVGWGLVSLALVASPLLVAGGPVAAGVWTVDTRGEAWIAVPVGLVLLFAAAYAIVALAEAHAWLARTLLGPRGDELRTQLTELTRSRLRLIDAFDVERRRIERDLHDGAQQQLVTLAMTLDLARIELEGTGHAEAARLVDQAHAQATSTMTQLRDLILAIHPPALTEHGLRGAVAELADRSAVPVTYRAELAGRLPESIETAAYFVLAEALTNAVKHSQAPSVDLDVRLRDRTLVLVIRDEGVGGADAGRGTGLAGLGDRVAAVGGRVTLSSPLGGPTILRAEIPCP